MAVTMGEVDQWLTNTEAFESALSHSLLYRRVRFLRDEVSRLTRALEDRTAKLAEATYLLDQTHRLWVGEEEDELYQRAGAFLRGDHTGEQVGEVVREMVRLFRREHPVENVHLAKCDVCEVLARWSSLTGGER